VRVCQNSIFVAKWMIIYSDTHPHYYKHIMTISNFIMPRFG